MNRSPVLFFVLLLVFTWALAGNPHGQRAKAGKEDKPAFTISKEEQALLDLTNKEREKEELPPLKPNEKLFKAARSHSANMAQQQKMEHELDGKNPIDRVKDVGYVYQALGENIAKAGKDPAQAVRIWMDSPPHKANILNEKFTEIGVGIATDKDDQVYYTQVFGTPRKR